MKNSMKIIVLAIFSFAWSLNAMAQLDTSKQAAIRVAFEESYFSERGKLYSKAIKSMNSIYDAKSYEINLRLGYLYYQNAQYLESGKCYKKAVGLKPGSVEAKFGYVLPLAALSNWDTVKIQYENILKIDAGNSMANYRLGLIYYNKADYKNALIYFEKASGLYPFDYDITLMNAWTNLKLLKNAEAKALFNRVLLISPKDDSALEGLNALK